MHPAKVTQNLIADFARGFVPTRLALPAGIQIVNDRRTALWLCELGERPPYLNGYAVELQASWSNTLELTAGELGFRLNQLGTDLSSLTKYQYELGMSVFPALRRINMEEFDDTLLAYSSILIRHRMLEDTGGLPDLLYHSICAGGLPCGCQGRWPEKPLIVYWPHTTPPKFE